MIKDQILWIFADNSPSTIEAMMKLAPNSYARMVEVLLRELVTASI